MKEHEFIVCEDATGRCKYLHTLGVANSSLLESKPAGEAADQSSDSQQANANVNINNNSNNNYRNNNNIIITTSKTTPQQIRTCFACCSLLSTAQFDEAQLCPALPNSILLGQPACPTPNQFIFFYTYTPNHLEWNQWLFGCWRPLSSMLLPRLRACRWDDHHRARQRGGETVCKTIGASIRSRSNEVSPTNMRIGRPTNQPTNEPAKQLASQSSGQPNKQLDVRLNN